MEHTGAGEQPKTAIAGPILDIRNTRVGFPANKYEYVKRHRKPIAVPARGRRAMDLGDDDEPADIAAMARPPIFDPGMLARYETEADFWAEISRMSELRDRVIMCRGDSVGFRKYYVRMYDELVAAMDRYGFTLPDWVDPVAIYSHIIGLGRDFYDTAKNDPGMVEAIAITGEFISFNVRLAFAIQI